MIVCFWCFGCVFFALGVFLLLLFGYLGALVLCFVWLLRCFCFLLVQVVAFTAVLVFWMCVLDVCIRLFVLILVFSGVFGGLVVCVLDGDFGGFCLPAGCGFLVGLV